MNNVRLNVDRLIKCREALGISKAEAARRIGISQPAYLRYESGARTPSIQMIKEMAAVFKTSPEYLTGESESAEPKSSTVKKDVQPELFDVINRSNQPELHDLIKEISKIDNDYAINRLLAYAKRLNEKTET